MTSARRPLGGAGAVGGLLALAASVPPLPGAACKGRATLFDGETPADRARAERVCLHECPALGRCRRWVAATPPSRRPVGVVAGVFREPRWR